MAQRDSINKEPTRLPSRCSPRLSQTKERKPQPQHRKYGLRGGHDDAVTQTIDVQSSAGYPESPSTCPGPSLQARSRVSQAFDPQAQPFQPSFTRSENYYTPYEPLRISNGSIERQIIHSVNKTVPSAAIPPQSLGKTSRESTRRNPVKSSRARGPQPEVLPSIESHQPLASGQPLLYLPPWRRDLHSESACRSRSPTVTPPTRPVPSKAYMREAEGPCQIVTEPRKLLVVLDLNGTLLYRVKKQTPQSCKIRPGVTPLLDYLFENHVVMVYTSARAVNAKPIIENFMQPALRKRLAATWTREDLGLNQEQYDGKVQVYKKLEKIWNDRTIQSKAPEGTRWDQTNTVLIDDSREKAAAQPYNLVLVPEYTKQDNPESSAFSAGQDSKTGTKKKEHSKAVAGAIKLQSDILKQLELKLEALKYQADASRLIRLWQLGKVAVPHVPGQTISIEEAVEGQTQQIQSSDARDIAAPVIKTDGSDIRRPRDDVTVTRSEEAMRIPGLDLPSDDSDEGGCEARSTSVSSIGENVFKELLSSEQKV